MGNNNGKNKEKTPFTLEELKILESTYKFVCSHSDKLSEEKLMQFWMGLIDKHLALSTINYLTKNSSSSISLKKFGEPYYIVERGTTDERINFLAECLNKTDATQLVIKELENYISALIKSYIAIQSNTENNAYESWKKHGYQSSDRSVICFAKNLTHTLALNEEHFVDMDKLERWLNQNPTFLILWREVFSYVYSRHNGKYARLGREITTCILPVMEGLTGGTNYSPILDIPHIIFVNSNLPNEFRHKWRFLFSSKIMGESFSTMLGKITQKGPTLLIVEDEDRYIFAGYAPHSWTLSPLFMGDDTSMLFTLSPAMRCFPATGYNDHYQYLNLNQQTMPNGLGMGGQYQYWGLWLDSEYGLGHSSESCTTYRDYIQLSKRKDFRIKNIEVFAIGDVPKKDEDEEDTRQTSVLDRNLEDRVILELSGKKMHSEGLREPDMDL